MAIENDGLHFTVSFIVGVNGSHRLFFSSLLLLLLFQCCSTSTETERTIKDGKPRTATSTFTRLLSTDSGFLSCSPFNL